MPLYQPSLAQIAAFTDPYSIAQMFAYWEASKNTVSAGNILTLLDISGNGVSARNLAAVGTGPAYTAADSTFNNQPSVSGGAGAGFRVQSTFDQKLTQPATYYLVMNINNTNSATVYWRSNAGNFTDSAGFYMPSTRLGSILCLDSAQAITCGSAVAIGTYVCCAVYNGSSSALYFNNSTTPTASSPSQGGMDANGCSVMTMGSFGAGAAYTWTSQICYRGAHSQPVRQHIMQWLGVKYGITVT